MLCAIVCSLLVRSTKSRFGIILTRGAKNDFLFSRNNLHSRWMVRKSESSNSVGTREDIHWKYTNTVRERRQRWSYSISPGIKVLCSPTACRMPHFASFSHLQCISAYSFSCDFAWPFPFCSRNPRSPKSNELRNMTEQIKCQTEYKMYGNGGYAGCWAHFLFFSLARCGFCAQCSSQPKYFVFA